MKLLKRPERSILNHDVVLHGSGPMTFAGRPTIIDVEIMCPDFEDPESVVWNRLKYGTTPELTLNEKLDKIIFEEDGVILYGIIPYEKTRTDIWEGCVYKCKIDHYENL